MHYLYVGCCVSLMNILENDFPRVTCNQLLKSNQLIYRSRDGFEMIPQVTCFKSHPNIRMEEVAVLDVSYARGKINSCDYSLLLYRLQKLRQAHRFPLRERV